MKLQSASAAPAAFPLSMRIVLMVGLLVVGGALSQAARAASDAIVDCKRLETSLRSLEVVVDEFPGDAAADLPAPTISATTPHPAPVLRLTPRVATIMREVFDALPIVVLEDDGEDMNPLLQPMIDATEGSSDSSPVVNVPPVPEAPIHSLPEESADNTPYLPRFQRQMYRTDI